MIDMIELYDRSCSMIERGLLPLENNPRASLATKVATYAYQFFTSTLPGVFLFAVTCPFKLFSKRDVYLAPIWTGTISHLPQIGVATAEHQVSGAVSAPDGTWAAWEMGQYPDGKPHIHNNESSGMALDYFYHPEKLIALLKELGVKEYRFSVDWSIVQPSQGLRGTIGLQRYENLCQMLKAAGIEPLVTFHHFNLPVWFAELGGFEKEENIQHFTNFCKQVFGKLSPYVHNWTTINEPALYVFQGWVRGEFPPGKTDMATAGVVLKNLLRAHCEVYDALHQEGHMIGISHNILRARAYHTWNPLEQIVAAYMTRMTHDVVMNFFKTGDYAFQIPFQVNETYKDPNAAGKFDFFGVQYYSDPLISMVASREVMISTCYPDEKMTNMPYRFYPEGLKSALEETRAFNKPVYITEVGIDALNEVDRTEFFAKTFQVISDAIESGIDVQKTFVWTLQDNFEWAEGWDKRFGLFDKDGKIRHAGEFVRGLIERQQALQQAE
jgi:beta-glucosidase